MKGERILVYLVRLVKGEKGEKGDIGIPGELVKRRER